MSLYKAGIFTSMKELQKHYAYIQSEELEQYWNSRSLIQLQKIATIKDENILSYIFSFIKNYMGEKKELAQTEAYFIQKNNQNLLFYDCRIFRSIRFRREENQMFTYFITIGKNGEGNEFLNEEIYEIVDSRILSDTNALLKCKQSCILKLPTIMKVLKVEEVNGNTVILNPEEYYRFIWYWTQYSPSKSHEEILRHLFIGLLYLIQNNLLLNFYSQLTLREKEIRRYEKPAVIILKPRNQETSTMMENWTQEVQWHRFRVKVYQLKFNVIEKQQCYVCYRARNDDLDLEHEDEVCCYDEEFLDTGDRNILQCFEKVRVENSMMGTNGYY